MKIQRMNKDMSRKLSMMRIQQSDFGQHDHHFFELAYVVSGTAEHDLNGVRCRLKPNDFFFVDHKILQKVGLSENSSNGYEKSPHQLWCGLSSLTSGCTSC